MFTRTAQSIGAQLRQDIGAHVPLIGVGVTEAEFDAARCRSDRAESLARYLVAHLADHKHAVALAYAAGVPAFLRGRA